MGVAPAVYRAFHFDHHRYTQIVHKDPATPCAPCACPNHRYTQIVHKDPELLFLGGQPVSWPTQWKNWLRMISGWGLLGLKIGFLTRFPFLAYDKWESLAPWALPDQRPTLAWQSALIALFWLGLIASACFGPAGMGWILFAGLLSHPSQAI